MVVDSSALIAILAAESDAPEIGLALLGAKRRLIGAPTFVETAIVAYGKDTSSGLERLDGLASALRLEIVPFRTDHIRFAIEARRRFGRGSGHPARLNFGDCLSYALAKSEGLPLLFKGDDFRHTDIEPALTEGNDRP